MNAYVNECTFMTVSTYSQLSLLHCVLTVYIHINSLVIIDRDVYVTMNNTGRKTVSILYT